MSMITLVKIPMKASAIQLTLNTANWLNKL